MNYELRNIVLVLSMIFLFVFGYYFLFSRQPNQYVPESWARLDCIYITHVPSDKLEPTVKQGVILSLNRCIPNKDNLEINSIVAFRNNGRRELGIIQEIHKVESKYTVVTDLFKETTVEISSEDILAVIPI